MRACVVLLVAGACGRIGFDAAHDAATVDAPPEIVIPAGPFMMGCNVAIDTWCSDMLTDWEDPYHMVTLAEYAIDRTEVTQAAYDLCMQGGVCTPPAMGFDPVNQPDHPIAYVTHDQATAYCLFAGKRLPSEAEWEKAARGTDSRIFPWGNAPPTCELVHSELCDVPATAPVGSKPLGASPYGLLDMAGNVWEWCADWVDPNYYTTTPSTDPRGPATSVGYGRVVRGGYYGNSEVNIRTSRRGNGTPTATEPYTGFRCARSIQ